MRLNKNLSTFVLNTAVIMQDYILFTALCTSVAYGQFPSMFQNPGGDPMHQGGNLAGGGNGNGQHVAMQYIKPCFPMPCMIQCKNGYRTGPGGCQYCYCNPAPVTPSPYTNPCQDAAPTCDANCNGNYVTGSSGCHYCICSTAASIRTTTEPPPTTPTTPSAAECLIHITNCQVKCRYGFMTDNTQCDLCVCKDEIYNAASVPPERQPMVKLSNPCIAGFDVCMIACSSGYRTGPRNCQYCACRE